jgi:hypothetical protein
MKKKPHLKHEKTMIFVNDYLIKHGRILNQYEENVLNYLPITNNIIVLNSLRLNKIKFKDDSINKIFKVIDFPSLQVTPIENMIFYFIEKYNYHEGMFSINWNNYSLENLDKEHILIMLYEINRNYYGLSDTYIFNLIQSLK